MARILQVKIALKRFKPLIWRRVLIKDSITFEKFHQTIQAAMGWMNSHLYEFDLGDFSIGQPYENSYNEIIAASKVRVSQYLNIEGSKMNYLYDFGDSWEHLITVEKILSEVKDETYPRCIEGEGNCPPEDCGGIWGYEHLLKAVKDKKHSEHRDMIGWLGGGFDPDDFNMDLKNRILKKL